MTPVKHAESSVAKWGGAIEDYIDIHEWFDETKALTGDWTHRAMRHHSAGIQWCIERFGHYVMIRVNGEFRNIPVKLIAERHVEEDCGFIPTVQDWMVPLKNGPQDWMLKVSKTTTTKMEIT